MSSEVQDAIDTLEGLIDGRPDEGIGEILQPIVDLIQRLRVRPENLLIQPMNEPDSGPCDCCHERHPVWYIDTDRHSFDVFAAAWCLCQQCLDTGVYLDTETGLAGPDKQSLLAKIAEFGRQT